MPLCSREPPESCDAPADTSKTVTVIYIYFSGLATQTLRQLKLDGQSQKDSVKSALSAALRGIWHEVRNNSVFEVGEVCARCGEAVEDLEHIVHHCPGFQQLGPDGVYSAPVGSHLPVS
eukprot:4004131-Amphidinium_carterae.1